MGSLQARPHAPAARPASTRFCQSPRWPGTLALRITPNNHSHRTAASQLTAPTQKHSTVVTQQPKACHTGDRARLGLA